MLGLSKLKESVVAVAMAIPQDATLEQLGAELRRLYAEENTNHHRMGLVYNEIVTRKLAEKENYKDAREYLSKHLADLSQASLSRYGTVAAVFSEEVARRFGITCLASLLTYKELAGVQVNAEDPGPVSIEVPDAKGKVTVKPFGQCTVEEMRRALRGKRKPSSSKPLPAEDEATAERFCEAVARCFPSGKGTRVTANVRNDKGTAVIDLHGIPANKMAELIEALMAHLPSVLAGTQPAGALKQ